MTEIPKRRMGFYYVDGKELPSVTTILGVINKPALMNWAAKQAARAVLLDPEKYDTPEKAAGAIYEISGSAADRGSDAHKVAQAYAESYRKGTEPGLPDHPYLQSIRSFFETMKPEVIQTEIRLVNTKVGYAGTADLIARVGPRTFVVDWKTSKAVYDEFALQVEAYRRCDLAILEDGTRINQYPMADATAVVLLKPDGTFQWTQCDGNFGAFLAAKVLFDWKQSLQR